MKVLIVDRAPSSHTVIAEILTKRGYGLLEVDGGEEAVRIARAEKPDIAIVDMLTPKLDRGAFMRQLRGDTATARIPIIFHTNGYLEVASGAGRRPDSLLIPILLCEEAIRGEVGADYNGSETSANGNSQSTLNGADSDGFERALIRTGDLIAEIVDTARLTFPESIKITSAYSDDLWLIEGDRRQLHRLLTNLFLNAREAMPRGGLLHVWARNFYVDQRYASMTHGAKLGQHVMLRVSDTGRGTARPVIDNIFRPFLDRIKSHGGFISVHSDLGVGTTFQIFLPATVIADRENSTRGTNGAK
jgi:hypothetical protein